MELNPVLSVLIVSVISLSILLFFNRLGWFKKYQTLLLALASGSLLADVFIHLLPEINISEENELGLIVLSAVVLYFFLESVLHIKHCHDSSHDHSHGSSKYGLILSDVIHNFLDGVAIASAFSVSTEVGIATTIAVILHEIPKEIGSIAILVKSGFSVMKSIKINLVTALSGFLGVLFASNVSEEFTPYLIAFTAGNFLYIALGDLLPGIHKENKSKASTIASFVVFMVGVVAVYLLKFVE